MKIMKKTLTWLLILSLCVGLLAACGGKGCYSEPVSVTKEEQLERTGIDLNVTDYCETVEYYVLTNGEGIEIPQINFGWDGVTYSFRAEHTNEKEPYNFSSVNGEWTWTGDGIMDETVPTKSAGCADGSWCAWIREGIAYVLSCGVEDSSVDAIAANLAFPETRIADNDEEWTVVERTPADLLECSVWKYDDAEEYVWIMDNETYTTCGADKTPGSQVRFWQKADDNTLELLDENGTVILTLIAEGTYGDLSVTDDTGRTLSPYTSALNGTYYCYMGATFFDGKELYLTRQVPYWLGKSEVAALEAGAVINHTGVDFMAINVTKVEKVNDSLITVTDESDTTYDLTWYEEAGAWLMSNDTPSWEWIGNCAVTGDTVLTDNTYTDLAECLRAHSTVYGNVTVKNGAAATIEIVNVEDF